jgi:radical SAM protein with 4Fe4S-binding SPASM domain
MCPRAISTFADQDIDYPLFQQIIAEGAPYFQYVYLMGGGEPLLNPDLFNMVRECVHYGFGTGFSTNATLLRDDKIDEIFASKLDYIILAFDGTTPEVYEKYRQGARFEVTYANIQRFLERKRELGSRIWVTMQMVRLPGNRHQVADFHRLWDIPGVNNIRIKEDEIGVEGETLKSSDLPPRKNPCHFLWQGPPYIDETGDVYPCCYMWDGQPVGNVRERSLSQIWNNDAMQALRAAHATGNLADFPVCRNCLAPRPRWPAITGSFLMDPRHVRKLIPLVERLALRHKISFFEDRHG